jgi:hypothetical protein
MPPAQPLAWRLSGQLSAGSWYSSAALPGINLFQGRRADAMLGGAMMLAVPARHGASGSSAFCAFKTKPPPPLGCEIKVNARRPRGIGGRGRLALKLRLTGEAITGSKACTLASQHGMTKQLRRSYQAAGSGLTRSCLVNQIQCHKQR